MTPTRYALHLAAAKHATTDARGRTTYEFDLAGLEAFVATLAAAAPRTVLTDEQIDAEFDRWVDTAMTHIDFARRIEAATLAASTPAAPQADAADAQLIAAGMAWVSAIGYGHGTAAAVKAMREALSAPTEPAKGDVL